MTKQSFLYYEEMDSPIGKLTIVSTEKGLCHIHFGMAECTIPTIKGRFKKHGIKGEMIRDFEKNSSVIQQLNEYFLGGRYSFDLPLDIIGTNFQKTVWKALQEIGYGETKSYKQVALNIGAPKAVRAIGGANNQNPLPIIIPCHRVIGSNGAMVGYGGGLDKKQTLLHLEGALEKIS
ncbi:methylated-DNA--[protein]-cysteine S-methyltransferase [Bacillus sp. FJAT-45350]|uniref:methylated-DNA--[protein]-cysteine S-methyltransferase n=1 Tax=Bacillus sp. FJAT-45350 TaxID=2011014 RepID=UPI000BB782F9|nr:methylated-DNA--[protein]-cysteine S-methyltransferase [Bacillus sp. FJAT-45350]